MLTDTSLRRESNCPVHFVWDGNGIGRPFVRLGFLLALVAGGALSLALMAPLPTARSVAVVVAAVAAACWCLGQVLTKIAVRRARHT
jgi:hypothetical protein